MKKNRTLLLVIISLFLALNTQAQTYIFPTVISPSGCTYTYEISIIVRLDSIQVTNIYSDNGSTGSFAFEAYVSYDNAITNSNLPPGNFYTYEITTYSDNSYLNSHILTNNAGSVPWQTGSAGGIASLNNPTYNASASSLGLVQGQYYSLPSLLAQLGHDSATIHINLPCMDTILQTQGSDPLPILCSLLKTSVNGRTVNLNWQTFSESNNIGFWLERSLDAIEWSSLFKVPSQSRDGNSNTPLQYIITTEEPTDDIVFYRVVQRDVSGRSTISNIAIAKMKQSTPGKIFAYPNPGKGEIFLSGFTLKSEYAILDVYGKTLKKRGI